MERRTVLYSLFALVPALLIAGCATVPMASLDDDARAKSFTVPSGKANIYVYRNETFGGAIPMTVSFNGRVVGQSGPQTFFLIEADPGTHEISSITENTSTIKLNAEAGRAYYIWQEVKMGFWMARSLLQQVDEATGRKGVAECNRAQSNP
jgi:hypothetical protein